MTEEIQPPSIESPDSKIICPTCRVGKIDKPKNRDNKWFRGLGDEDLWSAYSHVLKLKEDGTWSIPIRISSFYRCKEENCDNRKLFGINLGGYDEKGFSHGSFPMVSKKYLRENFKFISRETGDTVVLKISDQTTLNNL